MLDPKRLGLAGGIVWGVGLFLTTVISIYTGYGAQFLHVLSSVYPGFDISWIGSVLGLVYGFVEAFIFFFLTALVYNKLA